jgi:hypothetical protein
MRRLWPAALAMVVGSISISVMGQIPAGQMSQPPPQSARQALIEMLFGKGADDFTKHLPDDARQVLVHKGDGPESSMVLRIASIGRTIAAEGGHIETFDAGPNILISEQPDSHERIEVAVEHDSLIGEGDEIELSVRIYKDGQLESLPVVPRLTFTLQQQKEIWRLTEVTAAAHVPLTDPDYLKGLRKQQDESNQIAAQGRMMMIAQAESRYAANHKDAGYACTLAILFPQPEPNVEGPPYPMPGVTNEESNGYRFALAGCNGSPALKYRLTAVPVDVDSEMKALCVDESGTLKSVAADKKSICFSRGEVVTQGVGIIPPTE